MKRILPSLASLLVLVVCLSPSPARALLSSDYLFSVSNATYTPLTGPTTLIAGTNLSIAGSGQFNDSAAVGPTNIGFTFRFDCLAYTQFWVSASGTVYLGSLGSNSFNNDLANAPRYPVIAPWWDHQHMYNNGGAANGCNFTPLTGVHYQLSGSAPNRVLTIEFNTQVADVANSFWWAGCGLTMNRYQVRLYEGTNNIEFQYGSLWASSGQTTSATIGIGNGTTNFLSVTPTGGTATVSSAVSNNAIAQHTALIPGGTLYRFSPCYMNVTGTPGLATPSMAPGDSIFVGTSVMLGNESTYTPFSFTLPAGACPTHNYTLSISGPAAADYRFSSTGNQTQAGTIAAGGSVSGTMIFRPSALGIRQAFLSITDNTIGCSAINYLVASGAPRFGITGNIPQGGTAAMNNGDTLLLGKQVFAGTSQTFQPFTVNNLSTMGLAPGMVVNYTIGGTASAQYSIAPTNATLGSSQSNTPVITFSPIITATGPQPATLTVAADGISRTYVLYATAITRAVEFRIPGGNQLNVRNLGTNNKVQTTTEAFYNDRQCTGNNASNILMNAVNIGDQPLQITDIQFWELDTTVQQGISPYALTGFRSRDYVVTDNPATAPMSANTPTILPVTINTGATRAAYLAFVPQRPGLRYARVYIYTNARNFINKDPYGTDVLGLMKFDLFGVGNGALPVSTGYTSLQPIVCPATRVGDSVDVWAKISNAGRCDMRISKQKLTLFSGDIDPQPTEFLIVTPFSSTLDATNNYLIGPGGVDSIRLRFKPRQVGTRRAWLWLQTNDSAFNTVNNTERGAYYWDVLGVGTSNLSISLIGDGSTAFPPGVIDGPPTEVSSSQAVLRNTLNTAITITDVKIVGPNATDFTIDPSTPLPTLPKLFTPAEELKLKLVFKPANGSTPGTRTAILQVVLESGDTVRTLFSAEAGTRTLSATPATLFDNLNVNVGGLIRRTAILSNTGTLPLTLGNVRITGADSLAYSISPLARMVLAGGQTEFVELTFKPVAVGPTVAKFEALGNQTNGAQSVTLGGKGVRTRGVLDPSGVSSREVGKGETNVRENVTPVRTGGAEIKLRR